MLITGFWRQGLDDIQVVRLQDYVLQGTSQPGKCSPNIPLTSKGNLQKKLEDESEEVQKLLKSFGCECQCPLRVSVPDGAYQFILSTIMAEDNQDIGHTLPLHNLLQPSLDIFHTDKGGIPILALGVCELNLL